MDFTALGVAWPGSALAAGAIGVALERWRAAAMRTIAVAAIDEAAGRGAALCSALTAASATAGGADGVVGAAAVGSATAWRSEGCVACTGGIARCPCTPGARSAMSAPAERAPAMIAANVIHRLRRAEGTGDGEFSVFLVSPHDDGVP
ncbi:MAG: hypothetical protein ACREJ3_16225, partial [Polyangiaceae bacterium]